MTIEPTPTDRQFRRPARATIAALGVAAALAVTLAPSAQARMADKPSAPPSSSHERGSMVADEDRQLSALKAEKAVRKQAAELAKQVAGSTGGSYLTKGGDLVVTVTTKRAAEEVSASGHARPQLVDDTVADLDQLMDRLNKHQARDGAGSVQGWRVDTVTNSVVVTVSKGAHDAKGQRFVAWAKSLKGVADLVVEESAADLAPGATVNFHGGLEYVPGSGTCSVGFNAVDSSNRNVFVTAGHCVPSYPTASRGGYIVGNTRSVNYPGDDFAVINNNYPTYWVPRPWVDQYNGYAMIVKGSWGNPPVGATVCKSGRTTGWTCGVIRSLNQTVNYGNGAIYQLVRHNACVEPGDSGGSNISSGGFALGLTSGASFYKTGTYANKCLAKVPGAGESVSYYQPVGEALTRNGLRLLIG
jgi:hypothetical protein